MRWLMLVVGFGISIGSSSALGADELRREGREFFRESVLPQLAINGCPLCHAANYVRPNVTNYEELMPYLAMGDAPEKTAVIRKIANLRAFAPDRPTHPGGQRCKSLDAEPCKTIMQWWAIEFGPKR